MNRKLSNEFIQLLYPSDIKCIVCGREIHSSRYGLCENCKLDINENYCLRCGRHKVGVGDYCDECAEQRMYFDEARSAVDFVGNAAGLVRRLKYGNAPYLAKHMGEYMLDVLLRSDWEADCITFVPMHAKRLRKRGYNQAELLAQAIAERMTLPIAKFLEKTTATVNQARLDRNARMENLKNTFAVTEKPPERIVLVDDVLTTGSTLSECARMLKKHGAKAVYALTFASVPERPLLDKPSQNIRDFRRK